MARGRPVSSAPSWDCQIHLRLRVGEDDDLIAFLGSIPSYQRATAIKTALRSGGMGRQHVGTNNSNDGLLSILDNFLS